jgi:hypothetical protein
MYRLTLKDIGAVSRFHTKFEKQALRRIRVYRWGQYWGYLCNDAPWEKQWRAELHEPIASDESGMILDKITENPRIYAPPLEIDDVWDEEVRIWNNCMCNNLLTIAGTAHEVLHFCDSNNIKLPLNLQRALEAAQSELLRPDLFESEQSSRKLGSVVRDRGLLPVPVDSGRSRSQLSSMHHRYSRGPSQHPKSHSQSQERPHQPKHVPHRAPRREHISLQVRELHA